MKRFYKTVSVEKNDNGYLILLDGKSIKTPNGGVMCLNSEKTAELIANEWGNVGNDDDINPANMDYTSLASTTIDKIIPNRNEIIENLCSYSMNELLCYRNNETTALIEMQSQAWDSELEWAKQELNMPLITTDSIMPIEQDKQVYDSAVGICNELCDFKLTVFADVIGSLGSFVLAWGLLSERLDLDSAWNKSHIDETYQNQAWGVDDERQQIQNISKKSLEKSIIFYNSI